MKLVLYIMCLPFIAIGCVWALTIAACTVAVMVSTAYELGRWAWRVTI